MRVKGDIGTCAFDGDICDVGGNELPAVQRSAQQRVDEAGPASDVKPHDWP